MITTQDLHRPDRPILFDGAMGTELLKRGVHTTVPPDVFNLEFPGHVLDVHAAYVQAGAQVIQTNTFGANAVRLQTAGMEGSVREIIAAGCGLALEAAQGRALVAGSVGPLGEQVEPRGSISLDMARGAFAEAMEALMSSGVHVILIETMPSVDEAQIALRQALVAGAAVIGVSFNFMHTEHGPRTAAGETAAAALSAIQHSGAHMVGANCGDGFDGMMEVAREMTAAASVPIIIQPSAGIPETTDSGPRYPETPDSFSVFMRGLAETGVRLLGGCCGTGPEHIRMTRKVFG